MYETILKPRKLLNEDTGEIIEVEGAKLQLEHSLISLGKWESKWHKPFLKDKKGEEKTLEEMTDYIRCMTLNKNVPNEVYKYIPLNIIEEITEYIKDPMTATVFYGNGGDLPQGNLNKVITSEVIYYWMIALGIPIEFEKWHLNRLLTLIKYVNSKSSPKKKVGKREAAMRRAKLNAERKAMLKSKG